MSVEPVLRELTARFPGTSVIWVPCSSPLAIAHPSSVSLMSPPPLIQRARPSCPRCRIRQPTKARRSSAWARTASNSSQSSLVRLPGRASMFATASSKRSSCALEALVGGLKQYRRRCSANLVGSVRTGVPSLHRWQAVSIN